MAKKRAKPENLSREQIAKIEIGQTSISPRMKWLLVASMVGVVVAVPIAQVCVELVRGADRPQPTNIFFRISEVPGHWRNEPGSWLDKLQAANANLLADINAYEDNLDDQSILVEGILPTAQSVLTAFGAGNEQAYIGRQQWVFFRPAVDHLTGPPFLDEDLLAARAAAGSEWQEPPQPDPRRAILDFQGQLKQRGIELVVVIAPAKGTVHPEKFTDRYAERDMPVQNPSHEELVATLQQAGVRVIDAADLLMKARRRDGKPAAAGPPQFLETDTHWRPDAMELVAAEIAQAARDLAPSELQSGVYARNTLEVRNLGDVAEMLQLPDGQQFFFPQAVTIQPVADADGKPWQADIRGDVLLLGDSYSNIYSEPLMGWGSAAGLGAQLSYHLQRPVDALVQNDSGAFKTRRMLVRRWRRGEDHLAGKRLVVWEFAARELSFGDWKMIELSTGKPPGPRTGPTTQDADAAAGVVLTAEIVDRSNSPSPASVAYADHVMSMDLKLLKVLRGPKPPQQALSAYVFSMRARKSTPAHRLRKGDRIRVRLVPWQGRPQEKYGSLRRTETDEMLMALDPYWAKEVTKIDE
jgi:alginate O-acetyltransferase complex protein AlgJ